MKKKKDLKTDGRGPGPLGAQQPRIALRVPWWQDARVTRDPRGQILDPSASPSAGTKSLTLPDRAPPNGALMDLLKLYRSEEPHQETLEHRLSHGNLMPFRPPISRVTRR